MATSKGSRSLVEESIKLVCLRSFSEFGQLEQSLFRNWGTKWTRPFFYLQAGRVCKSATNKETAMLPRYNGETTSAYHYHLMMLRGPLTFDTLIGQDINHLPGGQGGKTAVQSTDSNNCLAICSNHVMRGGRHCATFGYLGHWFNGESVGVSRPLLGLRDCNIQSINPFDESFYATLLGEQTDRWEGNVHICQLDTEAGARYSSDWRYEEEPDPFDNEPIDDREEWWEGGNEYDTDYKEIGMLLDLVSGTLSVYQNGKLLGTLMDGLAGEYCWSASGQHLAVSIRRGSGNEIAVLRHLVSDADVVLLPSSSGFVSAEPPIQIIAWFIITLTKVMMIDLLGWKDT